MSIMAAQHPSTYHKHSQAFTHISINFARNIVACLTIQKAILRTMLQSFLHTQKLISLFFANFISKDLCILDGEAFIFGLSRCS